MPYTHARTRARLCCALCAFVVILHARFARGQFTTHTHTHTGSVLPSHHHTRTVRCWDTCTPTTHYTDHYHLHTRFACIATTHALILVGSGSYHTACRFTLRFTASTTLCPTLPRHHCPRYFPHRFFYYLYTTLRLPGFFPFARYSPRLPLPAFILFFPPVALI